jgi:hypothetical protein
MIRIRLFGTGLLDDEYVVDPYVVKHRSKTKSLVKRHIIGQHLVEVCCVTKSSNEGHILDHIWSKSTA